MKSSLTLAAAFIATLSLAQAQEIKPQTHVTPSSLVKDVCDQMRKDILNDYEFKSLDSELDELLRSTGLGDHMASLKSLSDKIKIAYKETNSLQEQIDSFVSAHKFLDANDVQIKLDAAIPKRDQLGLDYKAEEILVKDLIAKNSLTVINQFVKMSTERLIIISRDIPAEDVFDFKTDYTHYNFTKIMIGITFQGDRVQYFSGNKNTRNYSDVEARILIDILAQSKGCKSVEKNY